MNEILKKYSLSNGEIKMSVQGLMMPYNINKFLCCVQNCFTHFALFL